MHNNRIFKIQMRAFKATASSFFLFASCESLNISFHNTIFIFISLLHQFQTVDWSIDLDHFYLYRLRLIVHFESKHYQALAQSACARGLVLADLIRQAIASNHNIAGQKDIFCGKNPLKVYKNYTLRFGIYVENIKQI